MDPKEACAKYMYKWVRESWTKFMAFLLC
jgi:hypothetical protein